jgi:hypothetical protein
MWTLIGTAYIFYALYNYLARACFRNADKLTTELHTKYKLLYIGLSTHMDQNYRQILPWIQMLKSIEILRPQNYTLILRNLLK